MMPTITAVRRAYQQEGFPHTDPHVGVSVSDSDAGETDVDLVVAVFGPSRGGENCRP
jgi:hypothetical protein